MVLKKIIIYTELYDCLCQKTKIRIKKKKTGKRSLKCVAPFFQLKLHSVYAICFLYFVFIVYFQHNPIDMFIKLIYLFSVDPEVRKYKAQLLYNIRLVIVQSISSRYDKDML